MVEWLFNVWLSSRQTLYYDFPNRLRGDSNLSLLKCWYDHITHAPKCSVVFLLRAFPCPISVNLASFPRGPSAHPASLCCTSLFPPFAWLSPAWGHASPLSLEALTVSSLTGHLVFLQSSVQGLLPNLPRQITNLCCPFWQHQVSYLQTVMHVSVPFHGCLLSPRDHQCPNSRVWRETRRPTNEKGQSDLFWVYGLAETYRQAFKKREAFLW